jgi:phage replication O-like protein O
VSVPPPNYTQLPNVLLDAMCDLTDAELRVALAICRKTFGWHKDRDALSLSQIEHLTGRSRPSTVSGVNSLIDRGWVERTPVTKRGGQSFVYRLCIEVIHTDENEPTSSTAAYQYGDVLVQQHTEEPVQQRTGTKHGKPRPDAEKDEVVRCCTSTQSGTLLYPQKKEKEITRRIPPPPPPPHEPVGTGGGGGGDESPQSVSPEQPEHSDPRPVTDLETILLLREVNISTAARQELGHVPAWVVERALTSLRAQRTIRSLGGALVAELRAWLKEPDEQQPEQSVGSGRGGRDGLATPRSDPEPEFTDEDIAERQRQAVERLWPSAHR